MYHAAMTVYSRVLQRRTQARQAGVANFRINKGQTKTSQILQAQFDEFFKGRNKKRRLI
jgi:hypothetical protein